MWSEEARAAALEARKRNAKANGHNAGKGNRPVVKHVSKQHKAADHHSVLGGAIKGALVGSIVPGVGTIAGAAIGAYRAKSKNAEAVKKKGK